MTTDAKWLTGIFLGLACFVGLLVSMASKHDRGAPTPVSPESAVREKGETEPSFPVNMPYQVLRDQTYGGGVVKVGIYYDVLVSGEVTGKNLEALLRKLYSHIKERPAFKHASCQKEFFVAAYASREHFEAGWAQWIALLTRFTQWGQDKPNVSINSRQMKYLYAKPEVRFGLSEARRKEAYKAIWDLEGRADHEVDLEAPLDLTEGLRIGQSVTLTKETPFSSTLAPNAPLEAVLAWSDAVGKIPPGTTIKVLRRIGHKDDLWYYVEATAGIGAMRTEYGPGYMMRTWLYGSMPDDVASGLLERRGRIGDVLLEKYRKETADKYGITLEQLEQIGDEGYKKDWPASSTYYE